MPRPIHHRLAHALWRIASLPATLAHELTHLLLALPWATESAIVIDDVGAAHLVDWEPGTPRWAIVLASLGPTILGSIVGLVGLWLLVQSPPGTLNDWLLAGAIAGWWVIYASPSPADLDFHHPEQRPETDDADPTAHERT